MPANNLMSLYNHPVALCEHLFGVRLYWWQKIYLHLYWKLGRRNRLRAINDCADMWRLGRGGTA